MVTRRSTIEFSDLIEPILKDLELSGFDLKSIVNAGILTFSRLNGDEQKQSIKEVNGMNIDEPGVEQLKAGLKFANKAGFSETMNILNAEEREAVRQLRRALGPAAKSGKIKGEKTG